MTINVEEIKKFKIEEAEHNKWYYKEKLKEYVNTEELTDHEIYKIGYYANMIVSINEFLKKEEIESDRKEEK